MRKRGVGKKEVRREIVWRRGERERQHLWCLGNIKLSLDFIISINTSCGWTHPVDGMAGDFKLRDMPLASSHPSLITSRASTSRRENEFYSSNLRRRSFVLSRHVSRFLLYSFFPGRWCRFFRLARFHATRNFIFFMRQFSGLYKTIFQRAGPPWCLHAAFWSSALGQLGSVFSPDSTSPSPFPGYCRER